MTQRLYYFRSSVGRKMVLALFGLGLLGYLVMHLSANLQILGDNPQALDVYAHTLLSLGPLLIAIEIALALVFLVHIYLALVITLQNRSARPDRYERVRDAGSPSKKSFSSRTMIYSGLVILACVVLHVFHFKYAIFGGKDYTVMVDGEPIRAFSTLVITSFQNPWISLAYIVGLLWLFFHLRHGFWSAFQTLGVHHPRLTPVLYSAGIVLAVVIAAGYVSIPVILYFGG